VIQKREAQRAASAHSIRPGWEPQALANWKPKQAKPELKHLKAEAEARNKAVPKFRTTQECMTWLSFHGPEEASAGDNSVVIHVTAFDGLTDPISAMSPAHSFGSDVQHRDTSGTRPRMSIDGDLGGPLVTHRSDDEVAAKKSKRKILESQAMTAADDAMATLIAKYSEAKAAVEAHEEAPGFVSGDFIYRAKKARVVMIEEALNKLMSVGSD
jgi:hypothetical protein